MPGLCPVSMTLATGGGGGGGEGWGGRVGGGGGVVGCVSDPCCESNPFGLPMKHVPLSSVAAVVDSA